ncbi:MAG: cupin domain-containing protein, partial [Patescibacteria group bacterium]
MKGFNANIEKETLENDNFRKVLYTGAHSQLVLMSLLPNEDIGMEVHTDNDQFFRFEKGQGKCIIDGNEYEL